MSNKLKTAIFIGGFAVFTLAALYPVVVYPKLHPEVYRDSFVVYVFGISFVVCAFGIIESASLYFTY